MRHFDPLHRRRHSGALALLLLVLVPALLHAQARDSKGKEFWVTFMANSGSSGDLETSDLRIYLSCDRPTVATVTFQENSQSITVPLPAPNVSVEVDLNAAFGNRIELENIFAGRTNEITRRAFQVTAPDEVTLYGVNIRTMSADAFMSLPDDVLTGHYIVMAYPNGFTNGNFQQSTYDMPSEFAVIATEDGTTVKITSPANVNGRPANTPFTIALDSGQVFFGQARVGMEQDVSGTEIDANKPVAVYGGCKRTAIPVQVGNFRDHVVEQMPALESWGKDAIIAPLFEITPRSTYPAVVRVLAAFDRTSWSFNGMPQAQLNAAKPVELVVNGPMWITADAPICVAQYEHSVGLYDSLQRAELGDPFMMLIPPTEQFDSVYSFQCVSHSEFLRHFVNVVIPTSAIASFMLDGKAPTANFQPVPGSRFSYAQIEMSPGSHFARSDSLFGIYIYGYGRANSYGYTGGALYRTLVSDFQAPEISQSADCGDVEGVVYDDRITDTGVDSVFTTDATTNVTVTIEPFTAGADTVRYSGRLIDPFNDGSVGIRAIDSSGRSMNRVLAIPGFTLKSPASPNGDPVSVDTLISFKGGEFCHPVEVENYGKFDQTLTEADFGIGGANGLRISTQLPLKIPPGGRRVVTVCYDGTTDTTVTVRIGNGCIGRPLAVVPIVSRVDLDPPAVSRITEPCAGEVTVLAAEPYRMASGVAKVTVDQAVNCDVAITPAGEAMPTDSAMVVFKRINPRRDAFFSLRLRDAVGNERIITDTIPGFTLAMVGKRGDTIGAYLGLDWTGDSVAVSGSVCDSLVLVNYGSHRLRLSNVRLTGGESFSIPPAQLPLDLAPGERRALSVCIDGKVTGEMVDTLLAEGECGVVDALYLKTPVGWVYGTATDACDNSLGIQMLAFSKRTFISTPVPNPAAESVAYVDLGLDRDATVSLDVVSGVQGELVRSILLNMPMKGGLSRVRFDLSGLESGLYYVRLMTDSGSLHTTKLLVRK